MTHGPASLSCPHVTDLGAYLLGALPDSERDAFEVHLLTCPVCAAELADLQHLPDALRRVDAGDVEDIESGPAALPTDLYDRVAAAVDHQEHARRHRRWLATAAAAVVLAAGVGAGIGLTSPSGSGQRPSFTASRGPIHLAVTVDPESTGTRLQVSVRGVPEDERCHLVAISRNGQHAAAGSWTATYDGDATVTGWTSLPADQLSRLVLFGNGGHRLITVKTA